MMDIQPERPVEVALAGNETHQFRRAIMRGLKHGLLAQGVGQQRAGV